MQTSESLHVMQWKGLVKELCLHESTRDLERWTWLVRASLLLTKLKEKVGGKDTTGKISSIHHSIMSWASPSLVHSSPPIDIHCGHTDEDQKKLNGTSCGLCDENPKRLRNNGEKQKYAWLRIKEELSVPPLLQELFENKSTVKIWPLRLCHC
jgi:hypothetical protein